LKHNKSIGKQNDGLPEGQGWQLALFILVHILIFALLFQDFYKIQYSATGLYFDFASSVLEGNVPYRDFDLEYPPLSLLFFVLPGLIASNYTDFAILYQIEVLVFSLIGAYLIYDIARRIGEAPWKLLAIYTLSILAVGPIIGQQYDIFPAVMVLAALYFFWLGKHKVSWALLALGTLTKVYPVVIAPIFLIYYLRNRQYREIRNGVLVFAVISLVVALPFLILGSDSILSMVSYHSERGIQIESTYASLLLVADKLGLMTVELVFDFGSWNLDSFAANVLAGLSTWILLIFLLLSYWFIYKQVRLGEDPHTRSGLFSLLVIGVTLITSKVFSPQYLIWLVPLIPLVFNRWRYPVLITFVAIGLLTYIIFPHNYAALLELDTGVIGVLVLRNVLIVFLMALTVISIKEAKTGA
jgi:uncharacterized membrane protein